MKFKSLLSLVVTAGTLIFTSCETSDDCTTTCASGETLTADCKCVVVDPCADTTCSDGFICSNGECVEEATSEIVKGGLLTADETWTADKTYLLNNKVIVDNGITLTIEAGTIIKGAEGEGSLATALVIAQGGKLIANGTAESPIIFTSVLDDIEIGQTAGTNLTELDYGLWGGLIILGKAPISPETGSVAQIEGIPANETYGQYGGDDSEDNSGEITYVSVRHGGANIGEGNEINGITFGGVGSGTVVENVEVVGNKDDGIEFFGGTVNVTNAIVWGQGDDAFDIDQAYSGTVDNFISIAGADSDHSLEIDGPEGDQNSMGSFTLINGTCKGELTAENGEMADFRDGSRGTVQGLYFFNFKEGADLELDDIKTSTNFTDEVLIIKSNEFNFTDKTIADLVFDKAEGGNNDSFVEKMTADNTIVSTKTAGADATKFAWTYTATKDMLATGF